MHILLIEDDVKIAKNIQYFLSKNSCVVDHIPNGKEGLERLTDEEYDCVILDWMLPDMEGDEVLDHIRKRQDNTPVIFLTAKSTLSDKLTGFNLGADDYLTKPFVMQELLARVNAIVKRKMNSNTQSTIEIKDLVIDSLAHTVKRGDKDIELSAKQFDLLYYMILNRNKVITRDELAFHVWGEENTEKSNNIDAHISYLRDKIDTNFKEKLIKTIRGKGYMLCSN